MQTNFNHNASDGHNNLIKQIILKNQKEYNLELIF